MEIQLTMEEQKLADRVQKAGGRTYYQAHQQLISSKFFRFSQYLAIGGLGVEVISRAMNEVKLGNWREIFGPNVWMLILFIATFSINSQISIYHTLISKLLEAQKFSQDQQVK